jgi:hypothetical protein
MCSQDAKLRQRLVVVIERWNCTLISIFKDERHKKEYHHRPHLPNVTFGSVHQSGQWRL